MRVLGCALLGALVLAGSAAAFTRGSVLEPAAAYVAGQPVAVFCASSRAEWEQAKEEHRLAGANAWGFKDAAGIYIHPNGCRLLRAEAKGRTLTDPLVLQAGFIVTLVHESIHVRQPLWGEGEVECAAMHEAPRVMVKFFHVKAGKQLRAWMAAAWVVHRSDPPVYQSVC